MRQTAQAIPQAVLNAACDEARKLGLRTLVHANYDAVHGTIAAGCTQVEHGLGATDAACMRWPRKVFISTRKPGSSSRIIWTTVRVMLVRPSFPRRRKSSSR